MWCSPVEFILALNLTARATVKFNKSFIGPPIHSGGSFYLSIKLAPTLHPPSFLNLPTGSARLGDRFEPPSSRPKPFGSRRGSRCSLAGIRGPRWVSRFAFGGRFKSPRVPRVSGQISQFLRQNPRFFCRGPALCRRVHVPCF